MARNGDVVMAHELTPAQIAEAENVLLPLGLGISRLAPIDNGRGIAVHPIVLVHVERALAEAVLR